MSSSRVRIDGRRLAAATASRRGLLRGLCALAITIPALAACGGGGFQPMYASSTFGGSDLDARLAQVEVAKVPGRVGQRIRNELIFQNTKGGEAPTPAYRLEIAIREGLVSTLVQQNGESSGQIYTIDAAYRLVRLSDNQVVQQGTSYGRAGFERFTSVFSNVRAREDAENRTAKTVAGDIKTQVAAFLSRPA